MEVRSISFNDLNFNYANEINSDTVLTFGNFDGVHLGHMLIIDKVISIAKNNNLKSAVLTFEPHPVNVFAERKNFRITNFNQKVKILSAKGIDLLYVIDFSKEFSNVCANDFVNKVLINICKIKHIVVGSNCTFGNQKQGAISMLDNLSALYGYEVTIIHRSLEISSTVIREALLKGDIELASKFLGRPYQISGTVIKGDKRGRNLGYPTANVVAKDCLNPKQGVYVGKMNFKNTIYNGMINVGMRPTFCSSDEIVIEMHIFDVNLNLYEKNVDIYFLSFLRGEKKFMDVEILIQQIKEDEKNAREYINKYI